MVATAAIVIEPVLGEGGYVPATPEFMTGLREICDEHGILLVFDEVQSGAGRTGEWFAAHHYGVTPDVLVFAKGIASGYPLSGFASRDELTARQPAGSMGGTYTGNAVACAAALATIDTIESEGLLANVAARGEQLHADLHADLFGGTLPWGAPEIRGDVEVSRTPMFSDRCPIRLALCLPTSI